MPDGKSSRSGNCYLGRVSGTNSEASGTFRTSGSDVTKVPVLTSTQPKQLSSTNGSLSTFLPLTLFRTWAFFSFALMFSILLWHPSRSAAMNVIDAVFFLPALLLSPIWICRDGHQLRKIFWAALPLLLYVTYALISITWSETPNASRAVRMAAQLLALFLFLAYLWQSQQQRLLESLVWTGVSVTALVCLWHMAGFYGFSGASLGQKMYSGSKEALLAMGIKPMNTLHATLVVAPQLAMTGALMHKAPTAGRRILGAAIMIVLLAYLIVLEQRTGLVALAVMVTTSVILVGGRLWMILTGLLVTVGIAILLLAPEIYTSRGLSWRPEIWWSSLQRTLENAPWLGHGLSNTMAPVMVPDPDGDGLVGFVHPHNMALSVFHYLGAIGLVLWVLLWVPVLSLRLAAKDRDRTFWMTLPLITGQVALVFDGGYAFAAFDYEWFCFWFPTVLLLSSLVSEEKTELS